MRIVVDATAALSGGKVYLTHLLKWIERLPHEHEFIILHTDDLDVKELPLSDRRMKFRRVGLQASNAGNWLLMSLLKMCWRLLVLPWHLNQLQPDLIFSNAGFGPGWKPERAKLVFALHNALPLHVELIQAEAALVPRMRLHLLRYLLGRTLRDCDGVIVFSEHTKQSLKKCFGELKCQIVVIHHGIDWDLRDGQQAESTGSDWSDLHQPYVLYVSHLHRYKNVLRLLEAFAKLVSTHPALQLVLVGEVVDLQYHAEIEQQIRRLGLSSRVRQINGCPREEVRRIYAGASLFVHPSLIESFPFPVLEALATGVPTVVSCTSALPETAGDAALYFDPDNPVQMAETMQRILDDPALAAELRIRGFERAQKLSWENAARQTLQFFEGLTVLQTSGPAFSDRQPPSSS
ncbi:MAG TPA: glycosyltransferase family 1 protein [Blastocatellia bacterium]|nr:glycosyltransferase family 1 protein [Blastocatellia bacterium]